MAAPPPYWKKKTRPCPFYSQGRCLFSDACNFVHSVKIAPHNESNTGERLDGNEAFLGGGNVRDGKHMSYTAWGENKRYGQDEVGVPMHDRRRPVSMVPGERPILTRSSSVGSGSLSRTPSEKRRRVVLMSPPRSPRLSGLLSALEPVIGPDVEEVEITDEEDAGEDAGEEGLDMSIMGRLLDNIDVATGGASDGGDRTAPLATSESPMTHSSSHDSTSLAYYQDSPASSKEQDIQSSSDEARSSSTSSTPNSMPDTQPESDALESKPAPSPSSSSESPSHRPSFRDRVPSRIITHHPDRNGHTTTILDNNTLEVHSHRNHQHHHDSFTHQHQNPQDYHEHGPREQTQDGNEQHHVQQYPRTRTDDPLTALRGSRRHSTFELLTSPFTSPAHRILSPKLFPVRSPTSPVFGPSVFQLQHDQEENEVKARRPYADDDVDSLETLDSFNDGSNRDGSTTSSHSLSEDSLLRTRSATGTGSDETSAVTIDARPSPTAPVVGESEDIGSPQETERPSSDYSRTPRNHPSINIQSAADVELEMLPPLPPSRADDGDAITGRRESLDSKPAPAHNLPAASATGEGSDECSSAADRPASENLRQSEAQAPSKGEGTERMQLTHEEGPNHHMSPPLHPQMNQRSGVVSDFSRPQSSDSRTLSLGHLSFDAAEDEGFKESPSSSGESVVSEDDLSSSGVIVRNGVKEPEEQQAPGSSPDSGMRSIHETESESQLIVSQSPKARRENLSDCGSSQKGGCSEISPCPIDGADEGPRQSRSAGLRFRTPEQTPQRQQGEGLERRPLVEQEQRQHVLDDLMQEYPYLHDTVETPSEERVGAVRSEPTHSTLTSQSSSVHLAPLSLPGARSDSFESPASLSFGTSPITPDCGSSSSPDAIIEQGAVEDRSIMHETILERRSRHTSGSPKRLAVVSLTSPTKELRESYFPASLEKTVRPTPSPLYDDPQHSASSSSSVVSSPRPSWAELQRRSGVSNKVPFGFRQSLIAEESSSLSQKLASKFSRDSTGSRASSTSSLSPTSASTSAFNPRRASRVDMLSGRARSVSPALFASGSSFSHRHSIASHSSSAPSLQAGSSSPSRMLPRSASQAEFFADRERSDSPVQAAQLGDPGSSPVAAGGRASWMKPLRLSHVYSSASSHSRCSSVHSQSNQLSTISTHSSQAHVRNASQGSVVQNIEPSSSRSSLISSCPTDSSIPTDNDRTIISGGDRGMPSMESVLAGTTAPPLESRETAHHRQETQTTYDLLSPLSGSMRGLNFDELSQYQWPVDSSRNSMNGVVTLTENVPPEQPVPPASYQNALNQPSSSDSAPANSSISVPAPCHAIATPRPTLMFAIASDNPEEVERVLTIGEARPNDVIGPQSALEFALTNDALVNKTEIVKTLLAFGADVSTLPPDLRTTHDQESAVEKEEADDVLADLPSEPTNESISKRKKRESVLNPAMKYYLNRATAGPQAAQTSAALRRSDFRNLARMRFDFIGQDRALEHLYWVLGMHSQQPIGTPLVVLCCGPCGHGKSLLARKFGSLLNVPTHTVNMTVLKTSHDLWDCPSMSPYDPPSERTLAEFLEENAGKRCVVVLDEIDKNEDERTLWSLLAPWELGRCSIDSGRRHIDVRNVIWLGTSNIGQDLVFEHHAARKEPDTVMSKPEYRELMNRLRPLVTERLGTSLMSRVTAVLPFVPFTPEEKLAIASEAVLSLGGEAASSELTPEDFERLASQCVSEYIESDGARSLYRSVSTHLMEVI